MGLLCAALLGVRSLFLDNLAREDYRSAIPRSGQTWKPMAEFPLKHMLLITAVTISCLVAGCGGEDVQDTPPPGYIQAKQQWATEANVEYHFTLSRSCFCLPEGSIDVVVRGGVVSSATFSGTGLPVTPERLATLPTLSGLFTLVDSAYAKGAAEIRFTINAAHGFLDSLFIDYVTASADEEIGYTVTGFVRDGA
jgi:Family of unknown function (DUF6174)